VLAIKVKDVSNQGQLC